MKRQLLKLLGTGSILIVVIAMLHSHLTQPSPEQLLRDSYISTLDNKKRDYFVYLPKGYDAAKKWPVLFFLHGNG